MILDILSKQIYLLGLISAFIIGGILREEGYFAHIYKWLSTHLHSKKAVLGVMSVIGGILPVEGRCSVSAPILDSIVNKEGNGRKKMGLVDYISTHHYYLWSPIEPSVVIFMTALGISWMTFMQATIIPLALYLGFFLAILLFYVKSEDIHFHEDKQLKHSGNDKGLIEIKMYMPLVSIVGAVILMIHDPKMFAFWHTFPFVAFFIWLSSSVKARDALAYIKWPVVAMVGVIIALGTIAKSYNGEILEFIQSSNFTILGMLVAGAIGAFFMGSSSKYAGLGAAMISVTSAVYLPLVIIAEFIGYLLSPVHKCLGITKMYFGTSVFTFYKFLIPLSVLLLGAGFLTFFIV